MNVLVIPEDFRKDQYILKPIIGEMLKAQGKSARVEVCRDPLLGGIAQTLLWSRIQEIIERYKYRVTLFILCVDRDGVESRRQILDDRENKAQTKGVADTPDGGRRRLADEAARNYQRIRQLCPEIAMLESRLP